jgi:hypothetical protein
VPYQHVPCVPPLARCALHASPPGPLDAPGAPVAVHLADRRAPGRLRPALSRHRPERSHQVDRRVQLDRPGVRSVPPAQLLHDGAPLGDELGVGLQPGGTLLPPSPSGARRDQQPAR